MSEQRPHSESEIVDLVRSIDVRAPSSLHRDVERMVSRARSPQRATRLRRLAAVGAVAVVAVAIAVALTLAGGGHALDLREASALTLRAPTSGAPAQSPGDAAELAVAVEGVAFPYWEDRYGWRATGARSDRVGGREVTTVFYSEGSRRIGYAIVHGVPSPSAAGGRLLWRGGTAYRLLSVGGAEVVAWTRDGRLCVLSGRGVSGAELLALASWGERAAAA